MTTRILSSRPRSPAPRVVFISVLLGLGLGGCDDAFSFDPDIRSDTVTVFSLAVPRLNLPSAFSFTRLGGTVPVILESSGGDNWDVAFDTREGQLAVLPPGAFGLISRARVTELPGDPAFETVTEAPRDTAVYTGVDALPLRTGAVYVVRSREELGTFGARCIYFTKLQPLRLDVDAGEIDFRYDANVNCNDRRLVPEN